MPYVNSTAISRIEYDFDTRVLSVWFHETGRYDYPGVPENVYLDFLAAPSKGRFFNNHIDGRYGR